ncbi:hypothetical protein [Thalassotalea sp. PS06]|uniref:hypothetical protein n=1 Tax=Thalassotalea sp. PS06 TaxID=2594005 RepID=UPI001165334F|nr:hypothetical protein [Thalassotalea sp. PS06]QDP02424.1 hypothetical protein FNC98_14345 [Thalassotalea sp. PS06]
MKDDNVYHAPESDLNSTPQSLSLEQYRKNLIPKWIKVFGWLFIVMGVLVPLVGIFALVTQRVGSFSLYGLEAVGAIYSSLALVVLALYVAHSICAYGLLFGKSWGINACIPLAYLSIAICIFTMFTGSETLIRLELAALIPYVMKLQKLKIQWQGTEQVSAAVST